MEQKKVLWIVASLGIIVLVVFLGTLILYSPNNTNKNDSGTMVAGNDLWVNPELEVATSTTKTETAQPSTQDNVINSEEVIINTEKTTVVSPEGVVTIDLNANADTKKEETVSVVKPVETTRPSTTEKPKAVGAVTKKEVAPTKATAKPVEKVVSKDQYWVQAASYTSKQNAEIAQQSLIKQKIPAEVFPFTSKDDLVYYRVRVGPYTTQSEAEYWNKLIKTFEMFENTESYVTNASKPLK